MKIICDICKEAFPDKRRLANHKKIHKRNNTYQNRDWLYDQYINQKKSQKQIAQENNCNQATICVWMNKLKIQSREPPKFKRGNKHRLGLKHTKKTKEILSQKFSNEKNPAWKGDNAGYNALHTWLRKNMEKPKKCECCNEEIESLEIANISGKYTRNPKDYKYLCYLCHKIYDGTLSNMINVDIKKYPLPGVID